MDRPIANLYQPVQLVRAVVSLTLTLIACFVVASARPNVSSYSALSTNSDASARVKGNTHGAAAAPQAGTRTPSETVREFYKALREKRFKEAWALSIYQPAVEGLKSREYDDLRPDFERVAVAVSEGVPENLEITGEQISGESADVFVRMKDADGKPKVEPVGLIKVGGIWIVGDRENQQIVKKAGKKFFFDARINAHHDDVQHMLTRISLALLLYSQQHNGQFADLPTLITAGLVPKDIEGTETTGYRFNINLAPGAKSWNATAEPAQYGRTGRLSFYMDAAGVRSADIGGKPLSPPKN